MATRRTIVAGSRGSALAQWQMRHIMAALRQVAPTIEIETRIIKTQGDQDQTRPLAELGGLGVFTKAIEDALLRHEIDFAVHSLKDLPTQIAPGLTIAAISEREDARDCLVSRHGVGLMHLPHGARVGTSSARRTAQLLAARPDLQIVPLRGNVDTRLAKSRTPEFDAVVLAAAGISRLGRAAEITEYLPLEQVLPDPGQGALAVEIRADDAELAALLKPLDDAATRAAVSAERALLDALGGGCRMPIGTYAESDGTQLTLRGTVASTDGKQVVRASIAGKQDKAEALGKQLAARLLAQGASDILDLRPLDGKRILITRAREQAGTLADKLKTLGGEPVMFPTIDFAAPADASHLDGAIRQAREFHWVIFTSANGVHAVNERAKALGISPGALAPAKVAAIGPATAAALERLGIRVDFVPSQFLGEQIAAELPVEAGQSALLLRADIASPVLADGLRARGVAVTNVDAYRTVRPDEASRSLPAATAITFTSSSTVRNLMAMLDDDGRNRVTNLDIFCIGPVTAETARELGLPIRAVAAEHTTDGLVEALVNYYLARK